MDTEKLHAIIELLPETESKREILLKTFLADWKNALTTGLQITDLDWVHGIHGPENQALQNFLDLEYPNRPQDEPSLILSALRRIFRCDPTPCDVSALTEGEQASIAHVVNVTSEYPFSELIRLVYSVRPIIYSNNSDFGQIIDLPAIAANQHAENEELRARECA